ncbi:MAG TPA: outer membrane protein assembly factor BamE [Usitatibacter sp.]|jgi:outer membrane protein assembly factor BamE (lipoprotein component of BamABCDE complex)|nr:outer membrane protein assembly factor BamE [Usitatibacter sp.]
MSATKRFTRPGARAALSLMLVAGAIATASVSSAHAEVLPKFSIHVDAPRVSEETIAKVQPGMSQGDIEGLIGQPARTDTFARSQTVAWDYNFRDTWGYPSMFSVIFDDAGSVVGKVSTRNDY